MKSHTKTLTEGPLAKQIFLVSLPLALSNLLQVLFNMSDVAVVGRFAGSTALGAVGSTSILVSLFTGFLIGLSGGINVLVARFYGARHEHDVEKTVHSAAIVSLIAGVVLLFVGLLGSPFMLRLLNTKDDLLPGAILYLRVYFLGMPALALYNFGNAVFSAIGDTKKPLMYLSHCGRTEHCTEPVLCHRVPVKRHGRGAGQCHFAVRLCRADPARFDQSAGLLRAGHQKAASGPRHNKEHSGPWSSVRFPECHFRHCKPVHSGGGQLLRFPHGQGQQRRCQCRCHDLRLHGRILYGLCKLYEPELRRWQAGPRKEELFYQSGLLLWCGP